jgi:uncharacterized protein (DUF1800 family)
MLNSKTSEPHSGLGPADTLAIQGPENKHEPLADAQGLTHPEGADQSQALRYALPAGLVAFLSACGGGSAAPTPEVLPPSGISQSQASRFLQHAQFSARYDDIKAVQTLGYGPWLAQAMSLPNSLGGWEWLRAKGYDAINEHEYFFKDNLTNYMVWYQVMASPDPVRRRIALALSEFFVVSGNGLQLNWPAFHMARYWDLLCEHAFGNFRTLFEHITLSHAMGSFLNTLGNQKEDPQSGRVPDENFAREVMQLFSIGLVELSLDGTPKTGANGQPIETYTLKDVSGLAKVFTGYVEDEGDGFFNSPVPPNFRVRNLSFTRKPMKFNARSHSDADKSFLGVRIPAGTDGPNSLRMALDTLFNHPNVGPFFARQMIQRLVTSHPAPAYVARVASVFNNNGQGVRGDLAAVFSAVLLDKDAVGPESLASNDFGKLREPVVRIAQWAQTFRVQSLKGTWKIGSPTWSAEESLAQSPLMAPSVFNFFRPGYVPPGTVLASRGATAPEFQLVNESTVSSYINYLQSFLHRGMWVRAPELPSSPMGPTPTDGPDIVPDYSTEMGFAHDGNALVQHLNLLLCAGQMSDATRQAISLALNQVSLQANASDDARRHQVARALLLVMSSPDYLIQR